jgi:competence protein ComFC
MLGGVLDLFFPRRCVGCRTGAWPWCPRCRKEIAVLSPPGCERCGRPLVARVPDCADCPPSCIRWSRAPFLYDGPVRKALFQLKFAGLRAVADAMAPFMIDALARSPPPRSVQGGSPVISWVPLGGRRRRSRGYDQAEALAMSVGALTRWPLLPLLERTAETSPQARKSGDDRRRALMGVFRPRQPSPSRVVLVDDVLTSGATAADCARALLQAGAEEVGVLTAARSLGSAVPTRCYNPPGFQPGSVVAREVSSR